MCVCVYIYIYICVCVCVCIYTYMYIFTNRSKRKDLDTRSVFYAKFNRFEISFPSLRRVNVLRLQSPQYPTTGRIVRFITFPRALAQSEIQQIRSGVELVSL